MNRDRKIVDLHSDNFDVAMRNLLVMRIRGEVEKDAEFYVCRNMHGEYIGIEIIVK